MRIALLQTITAWLLLLCPVTVMAQVSSPGRTMALKNQGSVIKAGDVPGFTFYVPDKASAARFGLIKGAQSVWFSALQSVCKHDGKGLKYILAGKFLDKGKLEFDVLPLQQTDGVIVKISGENLPDSLSLFWALGAGNGQTQTDARDGLNPGDCRNNVFVVERNGVILYYPKGGLHEFSVFYAMFPIETSAVLSDARKQTTPLEFFYSGHKSDAQALGGLFSIRNGQHYYCSFYKPAKNYDVNYYLLPDIFEKMK